MEENTVENDVDNNVVEIVLPSAKDQIISGAIGVGVTLGAYALLAGGAVLYTKAAEKISARKEKRRLKKIEALEELQAKLAEEE